MPLSSVAQDGLVMMSSVDSTSVRLRWSPKDYRIWQVANKFGYTMKRYTFDKEMNLTLDLTKQFKPLPLGEWEPIADTNDRAAVVAQAMFGSSFDLANDNSSILQMINLAQEQDMRFSFAMLMAAQDFELACQMGLGDCQQIESDKKYLYRIFVDAPDSIAQCDTAGCIVTVNDIPKIVNILDLDAVYINGRIEIRWPKIVNEDYYVGYYIERSSDSVNFTRINKTLFVPFDDKSYVRNFMFSDTVENVGDKYFYRIQGVNFFGEYSKYSPVASVNTFKPITTTPYVTELTDLGDEAIGVYWEFPEEDQGQLEGFQILVSNYVSDNYYPVFDNILPSDMRYCTISAVGPSNYVMVAAYDKAKGEYLSMPRFIQITDTIPPMPPTGLKGIMDENGLLKLDWNVSPETDVRGYRVYYTTDKHREYTNLTNKPIPENHFEHKFPLNWLNRHIYVAVLAEDLFYNYSGFSDTVAIKMTDTLPPVSAKFRSYESTDSAICITWVNSSSPDLMTTKLIRYSGSKVDTLLRVNEGETNFCDANVESDVQYFYVIETADSAGNKSYSSRVSAYGKHQPMSVSLKVAYSEAKGGNLLEWDINGKQQVAVSIYRSADNGKIGLYKTIETDECMYVDKNIELNRPYGYRVKILLENGKTVMSEKKTIGM